MENLFIKELSRQSVEDQALEIVERKGVGHPDTICDSIMNRVSVELSKEYLKRYGRVLHHNVDKSLLAAGASLPQFDGGEVLEPMKLIFGDRATFTVGDDEVPVVEIAERSAKEWFKENLRFLDPQKHVVYQSEIKPGSIALKDIFERGGDFLGANDTSAAVGYAPLSGLERMVLELEGHINSKAFKKSFPESGEDVKIMGLRKKNRVNLTVAMAMVDRFVSSESDYFRKRREIEAAIREFLDDRYDFDAVSFDLNVLDVEGRGIDGLYLTVTGTSAEAGDSGQVGRGNNVVGVIPLNRPMSSEAAAGKNPTSHVGKIYNALCYRIADRIYGSVGGVKEVYVWLLSQIGRPINEPSVVSIQIVPEKTVEVKDLFSQIDEIVSHEFEDLGAFCQELATGKIKLC